MFQKGHKINVGKKLALGYRHTEEWKKLMREKMKGNQNGFKVGKSSPRKGKKSDKPAWNKGKKFPEWQGENHWNWVKDRTKTLEKKRIRASIEWREWRMKVFERDLYTCRDCGISGVYIEPHHIIPIREDMRKLFDVNNGITLCRSCHQKTVWKENNFAEKYFSILDDSIIPLSKLKNEN